MTIHNIEIYQKITYVQHSIHSIYIAHTYSNSYTESQIDRLSYLNKEERQTNKQTNNHIFKGRVQKTNRQTDTQIFKGKERKTNRQIDTQIFKQRERKTDSETDRQLLIKSSAWRNKYPK